METINVLLPNLPWKHCRNISGICMNVKKCLQENFKVYVHIARNESCFWICVSVCFPKDIGKWASVSSGLGQGTYSYAVATFLCKFLS